MPYSRVILLNSREYAIKGSDLSLPEVILRAGESFSALLSPVVWMRAVALFHTMQSSTTTQVPSASHFQQARE